MDHGALDPRVYAVRDDLAASYLRGQVTRPRYADGVDFKVSCAVQPLRATPDHAGTRDSEMLFGELFIAYDMRDGWAWGQCQSDGYVGYTPETGLSPYLTTPTHEITAVRSPVYVRPDLKSEPLRMLHMTSRVTVIGDSAGYVLTDAGGWICRRHVAPHGEYADDHLTTASRFLETPYLWGGRSGLGLDCSALIQLALARSGRSVPRDSDQQEASVGHRIDAGLDAARPGDLLFSQGHVAILSAPGRVIHANVHHMAVADEPLVRFRERLAAMQQAITTVRRP